MFYHFHVHKLLWWKQNNPPAAPAGMNKLSQSFLDRHRGLYSMSLRTLVLSLSTSILNQQAMQKSSIYTKLVITAQYLTTCRTIDNIYIIKNVRTIRINMFIAFLKWGTFWRSYTHPATISHLTQATGNSLHTNKHLYIYIYIYIYCIYADKSCETECTVIITHNNSNIITHIYCSIIRYTTTLTEFGDTLRANSQLFVTHVRSI